MKKHNKIIAILLAVLFVFSGSSLVTAEETDTKFNNTLDKMEEFFKEDDEMVINVKGNGTVEVDAELATVNVSVVSQGHTAKEAGQENTKLINEIFKYLRSIGLVEKEDFYTTGFYVNPTYDWQSSDNRIVGYDVSNNIVLKVMDIENIGEIITELLDRGANQINNLSFGKESLDDEYNQAIAEAVKNAYAKADVIARAAFPEAEYKIIPTEINETIDRYGDFRPMMADFNTKGMGLAAGAAGMPIPVAESKLYVNASVDVEFVIVVK